MSMSITQIRRPKASKLDAAILKYSPAVDYVPQIQSISVMDRVATIAYLEDSYKQYLFAQRTRIAMEHGIRSHVRRTNGYNRTREGTDTPEMKVRAEQADRVLAAMLASKNRQIMIENTEYFDAYPLMGLNEAFRPEDIALATKVAPAVRAQSAALRYTELNETTQMKYMVELVKTLPGSAFVDEVRGFGFPGYAKIIGTTGDLNLFTSYQKLWKYMGLAVMLDGTRQRRVADAVKAEEHAFSPTKRALMFTLGDSLIKGNFLDAEHEHVGEFRAIYLREKAKQIEQAEQRGLKVLPSAEISAMKAEHRPNFISKGHVAIRAQRYTEKFLLRRLWNNWRNDAPALVV